MIYLTFIPFMILFIIALWPFVSALAMAWLLLTAAIIAGQKVLAIGGACFVLLALVWRHPTRNLGTMLYNKPTLPRSPHHRWP